MFCFAFSHEEFRKLGSFDTVRHKNPIKELIYIHQHLSWATPLFHLTPPFPRVTFYHLFTEPSHEWHAFCMPLPSVRFRVTLPVFSPEGNHILLRHCLDFQIGQDIPLKSFSANCTQALKNFSVLGQNWGVPPPPPNLRMMVFLHLPWSNA